MSHGTLSRRRFLYQSGALAAAGALASGLPIEAFAAPQDTTTLTFWTPGGSSSYCETLGQVQDAYTKLHPNVRFNKITCGSGTQDFLTVLLARIAAGNPPDATIFWNSPVTLGAQGAAESIDDLMAHSAKSRVKDWPAAVLESCQFGGKTWGLPATAGSTAFWYNVDWFAKKGIPTERDKFPKTWDELRKLSKEFTQWKGNTLVTAGKIPMLGEEPEVMMYVWSALNGGQIYDAHKRAYTIDSEPNVALFEYMVSWLNEEYKGDLQAVNRSAWWNAYVDPKTNRPGAFPAGKMAIVQQGSWYLGDFYTVAPTFHRFNFAQFPVGPGGKRTTAGFWPNWLVIPKGTRNKEAAFGWLDYLGSVGIKSWFASVPDMPANKTVPTLLPSVAVQKQGRAFAADAMQFYYHQLDISIPMWNSPIQSFANDQLKRASDRIMNKVVKPKQGLAEAQQACQAMLKKTLQSA